MWKLKGYSVDTFDPSVVVYNIWANAEVDLPSTMTDIGYGTALGFGSTAQTFDDSKEWRWNGTDWIEQHSGQEIEISADDIVYDNTDSGMTATNVQDAIDEIKDLDDTQDNALAELYGVDANQQLEIDYSINTGSKNIIETTATDLSIRNCDFTVNADGSFGVHTTATTDADSNTFVIGSFTPKETAQYIITTGLSSAATGGDSSTTFCLQLRIGDGSSQGNLVARIAQTWTGTLEANTAYHLRFYFVAGQTISEVCQPMVKKAIIKSSTWEPYAPTNRELYETKAEKTEVHNLSPNIDSSTTITAYADGLGKGHYTSFIANTNRPADAPVADNMFIEIYVYSTNTALVRAFPTGTAYNNQIFQISKISGLWRNWNKFEGTQVATVQSVNSLSTLNLSRNELNEQLDTNFNLLDSIPEEEEGEEDV